MSDDYVPEVDDIKAMRAENGGRDLSAFLRQQIRDGNARRESPPVEKPPPPPGYKPGAWPTGTSPPEPAEQTHSPEEWAAALADYRAWITGSEYDDRLRTQPTPPCGCGGCMALNPTEEDQ